MLKSQAPSRQKVKGRLPPSNKRQKTTTAETTSTAAPAGTAEGQRALGAASPAIVSRWPIPTSIKVPIDHPQACRSPSHRGWQDPRFEITNSAESSTRRLGAATNVPAGAGKSITAATNRSSATASATPVGPVRRVKKRPQTQAAATQTTAEIDWRVPPTSIKPRRDREAASPSSRSSSRGRSEARAEALTVERSPANRHSGSRSSSGVGARSSGTGCGSTGSKSSNAGRKPGSPNSPRKKPASATAATAAAQMKKEAADEEGGEGEREREEEEEEKLPPCPYPGHKNVSWTCRGCGGTKHHLTSRSAMEPLRQVHGFKVKNRTHVSVVQSCVVAPVIS